MKMINFNVVNVLTQHIYKAINVLKLLSQNKYKIALLIVLHLNVLNVIQGIY